MRVEDFKVKMVKLAAAPKGVSALVLIPNHMGSIDYAMSKELVKKYGSYCILQYDLQTLQYAEKCTVHEDCLDYLISQDAVTTEIINAHFDLLKETMLAALPKGFDVEGYQKSKYLLNALARSLLVRRLESPPDYPDDGMVYYNDTTHEMFVAMGGVWQPITKKYPPKLVQDKFNFPCAADSNFGDTWYTIDENGNFYTYMFSMLGIWKLLEVSTSMPNLKFAIRDESLPPLYSTAIDEHANNTVTFIGSTG